MKTLPIIKLKSGRSIGPGQPCFVVAEIGNNHQGSEDMAREMIDHAARSGADAVKFQKRDTTALLTREGRERPYPGSNSFGPTYGEHRDALELSIEAMGRLKDHAEHQNLTFFASPWDLPSLEGLRQLEVELIKIASADLTTLPLIRCASELHLPIILSTGMSSVEEINQAVLEVRRHHSQLILLHCNSSYPCPPEEIALPAMRRLEQRFGLPVGYSGHEAGIAPSVAAVALGACMVERHFTLNRTLPGTDHAASLDPKGFARMTAMIREVEATLAVSEKRVTPTESACAVKLRKSIVAARDLPQGTRLTPEHLTMKSPGDGISPMHWDSVMGSVTTRPLSEDQQLMWEDITEAISPQTATGESA
ncbi:N-acetylneuraminate synthase family protein [Desulfovibrio ferrophilus]|uniref:N-acylneuraminate-9-phosphate synthase n=1 Tax=Desulfovibrio ferrophilus TaxID=241368 RepID=A0A2Z6AXQ8_9BACT|nr:N-acetylneuraminate synthase family protein [Desulfovibrio ferrophilus]BBD07998.1 N-acylneuraminate-9-phosphate synthase [Desulfovibrio ferrophilus]